MENTINVKKQMVKINFGFYGDKRYGGTYDALKETFNLKDLMPCYTTDANEFKKVTNTYHICKCCPDIPLTPWGDSAIPIYVQLRFNAVENEFNCCFKIGE